VSVINLLVAFYDIHGRKREVTCYAFVLSQTLHETKINQGYLSKEFDDLLMIDLAQWCENSTIAQGVTGLIPTQYKNVQENVCLYWVWVFEMYNKYVCIFIRYLESITQAL
jgi:hypothetical protein